MEPAPQTKKRAGIRGFSHIVRFALRLNWFISACIALVLFLIIRKYFFDIMRVNSRDMQNTYFRGDALIIRKTGNGYMTSDVIVFDQAGRDSGNVNIRYMQRIFGMPGDSFAIREKAVYLNGMKIQDTSTVKHNYFIKLRRPPSDSAFFTRYNLFEGGQISAESDYSYSLTFQEYWRLKKDTAVIRIIRKSEKARNYDETCFPWSPHFRWNLDHYGPLYIPAMGDSLALDTVTLKLYSQIITTHEKNQLELRGDSIFINGEHARYYTVKKNYYFVLGDNRDNAIDSRSWGYLPENRIRGTVIRSLKGKHR